MCLLESRVPHRELGGDSNHGGITVVEAHTTQVGSGVGAGLGAKLATVTARLQGVSGRYCSHPYIIWAETARLTVVTPKPC